MTEGGYDPKWAKAQIGMLTFLYILKDLEAHAVPVTVLDYLYGGGTFKERTSHLLTRERHYYLFKRTLSGAAVAAAMRMTAATSEQLGGLLESLHLKEWVKRQIRRVILWCAGWFTARELASGEVLAMMI